MEINPPPPPLKNMDFIKEKLWRTEETMEANCGHKSHIQPCIWILNVQWNIQKNTEQHRKRTHENNTEKININVSETRQEITDNDQFKSSQNHYQITF